MSALMTLGPVQMLVLVFDGNPFRGEILPELERLRDHDIVRLIDLLFVARDESGDLNVVQRSDLSALEAQQFGAVVGALIGLGAGGDAGAEMGAAAGAAALEHGVEIDDDTISDVAECIPAGSSAAIVLLEHRWAIPLRDAIERAGGSSVVDEWIQPADLVAIGLEAAASDPAAVPPAPGAW